MEAIQTDITALRKDITSLMKLVRKVRAHQDDPTGEKVKERTKNNGFNRPMILSPEIQEFLGLGPDEMLSRSAVTRRINEYVKTNGLKHPDNGRILILDEKLTKLLKPPEGTQVTYLNVQKYLSPHYTKADLPVEPVAPPPESVVESSTEPTGDEVTSKKKAARPTVKKVAKTAA